MPDCESCEVAKATKECGHCPEHCPIEIVRALIATKIWRTPVVAP